MTAKLEDKEITRTRDTHDPAAQRKPELSVEQKIEYRACREETRQIGKWGTLFFIAGIGILARTLYECKSDQSLNVPWWGEAAPALLGACAGVFQWIVNWNAKGYQRQLGIQVQSRSSWVLARLFSLAHIPAPFPGPLAGFYIIAPFACGLAASVWLFSTERITQRKLHGSSIVSHVSEDLLVEQWGELHFGADLEFMDTQVECGGLGYLDILATDKKTTGFVVIELKRDKGDDEVFGQLCRYMGWVGENLIQMDGVPVAGIIIAAEITPKLEAAAKTNPNVRLVEYAIKIELLPKGSVKTGDGD